MARPPGAATAAGPILATSRSALATPESLGQARQAMHGEALRLRGVRSEAHTTAQERTEHRVSELISRELSRDLQAEAPPALPARASGPLAEPPRGPPASEGLPTVGEARLTASTQSLAPSESSNTGLKIQATLELIEKIEIFVHAQRPALRMSVGAPLSAMVEVERTGPREVGLRIEGRHGPLAQEDLARIRDAMKARGLRLRSLRSV